MLTDSHCHLNYLDLTSYEGRLDRALAAARAKGVQRILCPGVTLEEFPDILQIVQDDPYLFAAVGLHPSEAQAVSPSYTSLLTLGQHVKVVGIGETGLDFSHAPDFDERKRQVELFKLHIQVAKALAKPIIVHTRDAELETIEILQAEKDAKLRGVLHCFTGSLELAKVALEVGFYLSFSGIITFRNAEALREVARIVPLDRILIETDAPYLAPVPMRGKPNEPSYLPYTTEFLAALLEVPYDLIAKQTTANFLELFGEGD